MQTFLYSLARHLSEKYADTFEDICIVFPNRRSGVFFKNYMKEVLSSSAWLPEIHTVNGFMEKLSGMTYADPIDVSFALYGVYKQLVANPETYDEFYYWGEMMISDFNDIDKYLVDAEDLFTNMADLKDVENVFDYLSDEQKELIRRFWSHFDSRDLSREQESFIGIWNMLLPLYKGLRARLTEEANGYEGMIYRNVAENIADGAYPDLPSGKVIICGFNALSSAEKKLFRHLRDSGRGEFYWDYDQRYLREGNSEAGRFIRENIKEFPPDGEFPDHFNHLSKKKNIRVYNLPSDVLQTKKLHDLLAGQPLPSPNDFSHTAVILGDEELLQSALSSLPVNVESLNITMGYPIKNTTVFSFIESLLRLQRNMASSSGIAGKRFYYRDVLSILNHQYVRSVAGKAAGELVGEINRKNLIYAASSQFKNDELLSMIFRKIATATEMITYLSDILEVLSVYFRRHDQLASPYQVENEFIFHIRTRLNKLGEIFTNHPEETGIEAFTRLFRKIMNAARIPFEGEPLQGIQLMGILETRLLDFENLLILSLNEGTMPATMANLSYIPANIRYAFGMPTREDKDAIYAYYFYRLIQRASNIDILYNSKTEGLRSGEPSRYIYQLKYLFGYDIRNETIAFNIGEKQIAEI